MKNDGDLFVPTIDENRKSIVGLRSSLYLLVKAIRLLKEQDVWNPTIQSEIETCIEGALDLMYAPDSEEESPHRTKEETEAEIERVFDEVEEKIGLGFDLVSDDLRELLEGEGDE